MTLMSTAAVGRFAESVSLSRLRSYNVVVTSLYIIIHHYTSLDIIVHHYTVSMSIMQSFPSSLCSCRGTTIECTEDWRDSSVLRGS